MFGGVETKRGYKFDAKPYPKNTTEVVQNRNQYSVNLLKSGPGIDSVSGEGTTCGGKGTCITDVSLETAGSCDCDDCYSANATNGKCYEDECPSCSQYGTWDLVG